MAYVTVVEMKAQGIGEDSTDVELVSTEAIVREYIEDLTHQFFEERTASRKYDGDGTELLVLDHQINSVTAILFKDGFGGSYTPQNLDNFSIYDGFENRGYPRIAIDGSAGFGAFNQGIFPRGRRNILIEGSFGCVKNGQAPAMIKEATMMLAAIYLGKIGTGELQKKLKMAGVIEDETSKSRYKLTESMQTGNMTGIPYIDNILNKYKLKSRVTHT